MQIVDICFRSLAPGINSERRLKTHLHGGIWRRCSGGALAPGHKVISWGNGRRRRRVVREVLKPWIINGIGDIEGTR